jgi:hypothetical protein
LVPSFEITTSRQYDVIKNQQMIHAELRASDTPYLSLSELMLELGLSNSESCKIEILTESPAKILPSSIIQNKKATISVATPINLEEKNLKVSYKLFYPNRVERGVLTSNIKWQNESHEVKTMKVHLNVDECVTMHVFASINGMCVEDMYIIDPTVSNNPRAVILEVFDNRFGMLNRYLAGEGERKASNFERSIGDLLTTLGFSVWDIGDNRYGSNRPDIVAITPNNNVIVIDCTLEQPNQGDKLSKLEERTQSIKRALKEQYLGHTTEVLPVLITCL